MTAEEIAAELQRMGAKPELIQEVKDGYMRTQDYTEKNMELGRQREQIAYALGQQAANRGPASAPKRKVDEYLDRFDGEEHAGVREVLSGLVEAITQDFKQDQEAALRPVVEGVRPLTWTQELDRRLESELVPLFGEGIRGEWPSLRGEMIEALKRNEGVSPAEFVLKAHPEKASQMIAARVTAGQKEQGERTPEGFAQFTRTTPMGEGSGPRAAGTANGNGSEAPARGSLPPTVQALQERFSAVAAQVAEGGSQE